MTVGLIYILLVSTLQLALANWQGQTLASANRDSFASGPLITLPVAPNTIPIQNSGIYALNLRVSAFPTVPRVNESDFSLLLAPLRAVAFNATLNQHYLQPDVAHLLTFGIRLQAGSGQGAWCAWAKSTDGHFFTGLSCRSLGPFLAPEPLILGMVVNTSLLALTDGKMSAEVAQGLESSLRWRPAAYVARAYSASAARLPANEQLFEIHGWGFGLNSSATAQLFGPIGVPSMPIIEVGTLDCRSDLTVGYRLQCGAPPASDVAQRIRKFPGMYSLRSLQIGETTITNDPRIDWAVIIPSITPSTRDYSKNLFTQDGLVIHGDGFRGPSSDWSVGLSSGGRCGPASRVSEASPENQQYGTWELFCNGTGANPPSVGPLTAALTVIQSGLQMSTDRILVANVVNPPYFNGSQAQTARLPSDGIFAGLVAYGLHRNASLNVVTILTSTRQTVPCVGTQLTTITGFQGWLSLECEVPPKYLPFPVGALGVSRVSANGAHYNLGLPSPLGYARYRPLLTPDTNGILVGEQGDVTISGQNFFPALSQGRDVTVALWALRNRTNLKAPCNNYTTYLTPNATLNDQCVFVPGPGCAVRELTAVLVCSPNAPFTVLEPIFASITIDGIEDSVSATFPGQHTLVAVVRGRPELIPTPEQQIDFELTAKVRIEGRYLSGQPDSNKVVLYPQGTCQVIAASEGFPLRGESPEFSLGWVDCIVSSVARGPLSATISVDGITQLNPDSKTALGFIKKYPSVIETRRAQLPRERSLLLRGDGFSTDPSQPNQVALSRGACIPPVLAVSETVLNCTFPWAEFPLDPDGSPFELQVLRIFAGDTHSRFHPTTVATIRNAPQIARASLFLRPATEPGHPGTSGVGLSLLGSQFDTPDVQSEVFIELLPGNHRCVPSKPPTNGTAAPGQEILACLFFAPQLITPGDYSLNMVIQEGVHLSTPFPLRITPLIMPADFLNEPVMWLVTQRTFQLGGFYFSRTASELQVALRVVPLAEALPFLPWIDPSTVAPSSVTTLFSNATVAVGNGTEFSLEDSGPYGPTTSGVVLCPPAISSTSQIICTAILPTNTSRTSFNHSGVVLAQVGLRGQFLSPVVPIGLLSPVISRTLPRVTTSTAAEEITIHGLGFGRYQVTQYPKLISVALRMDRTYYPSADPTFVACEVLGQTESAISCALPPRLNAGAYAGVLTVEIGRANLSLFVNPSNPLILGPSTENSTAPTPGDSDPTVAVGLASPEDLVVQIRPYLERNTDTLVVNQSTPAAPTPVGPAAENSTAPVASSPPGDSTAPLAENSTLPSANSSLPSVNSTDGTENGTNQWPQFPADKFVLLFIRGMGFTPNHSLTEVQLSSSTCQIALLTSTEILCAVNIRTLFPGNLYAVVRSNLVDSMVEQVATISLNGAPVPAYTPTPRQSPPPFRIANPYGCTLPGNLCDPGQLTSGVVAGVVTLVIAALCAVAGGVSIWLRRVAKRQQRQVEAQLQEGVDEDEDSPAAGASRWTMKDLEVVLSGDGVLDEDETNSAWMTELTTKVKPPPHELLRGEEEMEEIWADDDDDDSAEEFDPASANTPDTAHLIDDEHR